MFRQIFSDIGRYISSIKFNGLFITGLLLSSDVVNASRTDMRAFPRNKYPSILEGDGNDDALRIFGSMPSEPPPDPSQIALRAMGGLPSDEETEGYMRSLSVTDDWDEEYESDVEQTADEDVESEDEAKRAPRRIEKRAADINYVPDTPVQMANGTNMDMTCSSTIDTGLAVWQEGGNIHAQPFNTTDPTQRGSEIVFTGSRFQVTDLSNGGYTLAYWVNDNTLRVKILDSSGSEMRDISVPSVHDDTGNLPSIASYPGGFFIGFAGSSVEMYHVSQRFNNNGDLVDEREGPLTYPHNRCAVAVSGSTILDVYDKSGNELICNFIATTGGDFLDPGYTAILDAAITAVSSHDVKFGKSDEFVVAAAVTESSLPKVYALFGHTTSDFFTECTFSNRIAIPDIYYGPIEVRPIGKDREGLPIYDIVGRDFTGKLVGCQCWYNNSTDVPEFSPTVVIQENVQGSSTAVDRLGRLWRGLWTTANEIFIQPFTCTPVPCAQTTGEVHSYPSESSSSSTPSSSDPASSSSSKDTSTPSSSALADSSQSSVDPEISSSSTSSIVASISPDSSKSVSSSAGSSDPIGSDVSSESGNPGDSSSAVTSVTSLSNTPSLESSNSSQLPVSYASSMPGGSNIAAIIAAIAGSIVGVGVTVGGIAFAIWRRRRTHGGDLEMSSLGQERLPFVKEKEIGDGSFGIVYRGKWTEDGPNKGLQVAIKTLKKTYADPEMGVPEIQNEFAAEASLLRDNTHPNIVRYIGYIGQPHWCIVMEFCSEGSLSRILRDTVKYPFPWATDRMDIMRGAAEGLRFLHKKNIVHRDMKPDNILIQRGPDGRMVAKLTDLGTARFKEQTLRTMTNGVGTPTYMAPEVVAAIEGKRTYGPEIDVYSFGLVLWAIWMRKDPYADFDNSFAMMNYVEKEGRPLTEGCPSYTLAQLMSSCWEHRSGMRPPMLGVCNTLDQVAKEVSHLTY